MLLPDTAVFEFEDGEAEMRLDGLSTREFLELNDFLFEPDQWATPDGLRRLASIVDERRVRWTYEGTAEDRPFQFNLALARAWVREVGKIPLPLPVRRSEPVASDDPS